MAVRFDKFTLKAQEAVATAQSRAESLEHAAIEPEHLLSALVGQQDGIVLPLLGRIGAAPDSLRAYCETAPRPCL